MNVLPILFVGALQVSAPVQLQVVEDVGLAWESVELESRHSSLGRIKARAAVRNGGDASFLDRLEVSTSAGRVVCDRRFFSDLPFPEVGSIQVIARADSNPSTRDFSVRFRFGEEAIEERFPEVIIKVNNLRCTGRSFAVPAEDGDTLFQDEAPSRRE